MKTKCYIYLQGGSVIEVDLKRQVVTFDSNMLKILDKEDPKGSGAFFGVSGSICLPSGMIDRFEIE